MTPDAPDRQDLIARLSQLPAGSLAELLADLLWERMHEKFALPEEAGKGRRLGKSREVRIFSNGWKQAYGTIAFLN